MNVAANVADLDTEP